MVLKIYVIYIYVIKTQSQEGIMRHKKEKDNRFFDGFWHAIASPVPEDIRRTIEKNKQLYEDYSLGNSLSLFGSGIRR
jgi:hypothetical protein